MKHTCWDHLLIQAGASVEPLDPLRPPIVDLALSDQEALEGLTIAGMVKYLTETDEPVGAVALHLTVEPDKEAAELLTRALLEHGWFALEMEGQSRWFRAETDPDASLANVRRTVAERWAQKQETTMPNSPCPDCGGYHNHRPTPTVSSGSILDERFVPRAISSEKDAATDFMQAAGDDGSAPSVSPLPGDPAANDPESATIVESAADTSGCDAVAPMMDAQNASHPNNAAFEELEAEEEEVDLETGEMPARSLSQDLGVLVATLKNRPEDGDQPEPALQADADGTPRLNPLAMPRNPTGTTTTTKMTCRMTLTPTTIHLHPIGPRLVSST